LDGLARTYSQARSRRQALRGLAGAAVGVLALGGREASAEKGGNSSDAAACKDDGYLIVTRADGSPFANAGQCTRYTAQGGVFGTLSISVFANDFTCIVATKLAGFLPNTGYLFIQERGDGPGSTANPVIVNDPTVFTDQFGESEHQASFFEDYTGYLIRVTVGGVVTDWTEIAC
jgi:hypothetical protein